MSRKTYERRAKFKARDDAGNIYWVSQIVGSVEMSDSEGTQRDDVVAFYVLEDGTRVRRTGKGEYVLSRGFPDPDIILRSDDPKAV